MSNKKLTIGLFGFGCVGQGLVDVLNNSKQFSAEIKKICIKNPHKPRTLPGHLFTTDKWELLDNPEINTIVELIDDAEDAYTIISHALKNGKNVVTANKKVLATHLEEFIRLQNEYGTSLIYEGAACGGIPIIRTLEEYYDNEELNTLSGIFNGSSNYILTKIYREGLSYSDALKKAQELGFAETDPTLDVEGFDPKFKLVILALHAFGIILDTDEVVNLGINNLGNTEIELYKEKGIAVKLHPILTKLPGNTCAAYVLPWLVPYHHTLYNVHNEYNAVVVEGIYSNEQLFIGKGAGGHPTGSAVLSDISALSYHYRYSYKKYFSENKITHTNAIGIDLYASGNREAIEELFGEPLLYTDENPYIITRRSLEWIHRNRERLATSAVFVASVHPEVLHTLQNRLDHYYSTNEAVG